MTIKTERLIVLLVLLLFINLPLISALEISNVQAVDITDTSAMVQWSTDEPADSFVSYGEAQEELLTKGDAKLVTEHQFSLEELSAETEYYFKVESNQIVDDNSGNLYSFTTLAPDVTAPEISVELAAITKGNQLDLTGITEAGATVNAYVNNILMATTEAGAEGEFAFSELSLTSEQENPIKIEAQDAAGNTVSWEGTTFADMRKPVLELEEIPELYGDSLFELNGTISEESSYEIFVNNKSSARGTGTAITDQIRLDEGENKIKIVVTDPAGWETVEEVTITADTQPPRIKAKIEKGNEFYEGRDPLNPLRSRASSNINGETEPGAVVYLYIYKPLTFEFRPDFERARAKIVANEEGKFTFEEVDFAATDFRLEDLRPREVPSGLLDLMIYPVEEAQQRYTYHVYLIVEDKSGKTAYWKEMVTVRSCYSPNFAFSVESMPQFQGPLKLVPQILDEGRQEIQAALDIHYLGGIYDEDEEAPFEILDVRVERACTQAMQKDETFGVGCKLLSKGPTNVLPNADKTKVYVTWNLQGAEKWSDREKDFWNEFLDRQLIFPLKITVQYREKEGDTFGPQQFQTSCLDLGYLVDIPIKSDELIPDFLANEGVEALNWTISQIQTIKPFIEDVYFWTAIGAFSFWGLKFVARAARIISSKVEGTFGEIEAAADSENKEKYCKLNQNELYLEETINDWKGKSNVPVSLGNPDIDQKTISLDKRCPTTAKMWGWEMGLDQAYRWTWDRVGCREVPAGWTEDKDLDKIDAAIIRQQECGVTGRGVPLQEIENCAEFIKVNPVNIPYYTTEGSGRCWRDAEKIYVVHPEQDKKENKRGVYKLKSIGSLYRELTYEEELFVYQPQGSDQFLVGREESCADVCDDPRKEGYRADQSGLSSVIPGGTILGIGRQLQGTGDEHGCYNEKIIDGETRLVSPLGHPLKDNRYAAGYTKDCFVKKDASGKLIYNENYEPIFQQCVCVGEKEEKKKYQNEPSYTLRTADPKEKWIYRQDRVFKESRKTRGTYYPSQRYYSGRDLSGAFGADYLLDYTKSIPEIPSIDPHNDFVAMFQTVCLPAILKKLVIWEQIMVGLRNCIIQAKYTGLHDAGMCKTLFTQHICGLAYKAIAYAMQDCTPSNFDDKGKESVFGDIGIVFSEGTKGLGQALDTSITDLQDEYGNAVLTDYFRGGAQGFAQSMCLAAFGYEFPFFSKDFLLDQAYAFPMATVPLIFPALRERSTYNPQRKTAIYNYEIGGTILPGCRIKRWTLSLKCIGQEDKGNPGVDTSCYGEGCDCLNIQSGLTEGRERMKLLTNGHDLLSTGVFDIPLESPIRVDSPYRYDHVVLELELDPSERGHEEACFDEGYLQGNKGVFYFPIKDISPPGEFICHASTTSGKYICPELYELFGFGDAYLESPYVSCWNKRTEEWVSCDTPNLFIMDDEIKVMVHVQADGKGQCLRRTVRGVPGISDAPYSIAILEQLPGQHRIKQSLGVVSESMFGGVSNAIFLDEDRSNRGCSQVKYDYWPEKRVSPDTVEFKYKDIDGTYVQLFVPSGVIPQGNYETKDDYLALAGNKKFTIQEINQVIFEIEGFLIHNVLGDVQPDDTEKRCTYKVSPRSSLLGTSGSKHFTVTYELLEKDEGGSCAFAKDLVKSTQGKAKFPAKITIQRELTAIAGMHENFMSGNYNQVHQLTLEVFNQQQGDLSNALAVYYEVASLVMLGKDKYLRDIEAMFDLFFKRQWKGDKIADYDTGVVNSGEYQKIKMYLCVIDKEILNEKYPGDCAVESVAPPTPAATPGSEYLCGKEGTKADFSVPDNWNQYDCMTKAEYGSDWETDCLKKATYIDESGKGCPGRFGAANEQRCCPPKQNE